MQAAVATFTPRDERLHAWTTAFWRAEKIG